MKKLGGDWILFVYRLFSTVLAGVGLLLISVPSLAAITDDINGPQLKAARGFYTALDSGYVGTFYKNAFGGDNTWRQGSGNATVGGLAGYQFTKSLALELGYNYVFRAKAINNTASGSSTVAPQVVYGALKIIAPIYPRLDVFAKAGLGYMYQTMESNGAGADGPIVSQPRTHSHIGAALGVGASYYFTPSIYSDVTYMRFSGQFEARDNSAATIDKQFPNLNMFMLGIGYYFGP